MKDEAMRTLYHRDFSLSLFLSINRPTNGPPLVGLYQIETLILTGVPWREWASISEVGSHLDIGIDIPEQTG